MQINFNDTFTVSLRKAGKSLEVNFADMPEVSLRHVVEYGIRQILNDAMASAKTEAEALGAAQKRLDNLMSGTLRASPIREGNPVRARALELAEAKIVRAPKFVAWLAEAKLKASDKDARAKLRELAKKAIDVEDNAFVKQAEIDVAAAKELSVDDIELDI